MCYEVCTPILMAFLDCWRFWVKVRAIFRLYTGAVFKIQFVLLQIAYAMRMSMAEHETSGDHSMDVDDEAKEGEEEDYSEVLQDPAFIQVNHVQILSIEHFVALLFPIHYTRALLFWVYIRICQRRPVQTVNFGVWVLVIKILSVP